ncbi:hypothetical protein JCM8202_005414 [Rhodotorula sphaerocarpa]
MVAVGALWATFLTHPSTPAPPAGSAEAITLCIVPFVSLGASAYAFAIRPWRVRRRRRHEDQFGHRIGGAGLNQVMMPILTYGLPGHPPSTNPYGRAWSGSKWRGGLRGSPAHGPGGTTTVNLVVDPALLSSLRSPPLKERQKARRAKQKRRRAPRPGTDPNQQQAVPRAGPPRHSKELGDPAWEIKSSASSSDEWSDPDDPYTPRTSIRKAQQPFASPATEARWREDRSWTRKVLAYNALSAVVWIALAVWTIGWGRRCPPGACNGYCDWYNTALAFAVITGLACLLGAVLDVFALRYQHALPAAQQI